MSWSEVIAATLGLATGFALAVLGEWMFRYHIKVIAEVQREHSMRLDAIEKDLFLRKP